MIPKLHDSLGINSKTTTMKPLDHTSLIKAKPATTPLESPLPPELVRFVQALARMAAKEDYEYFCQTGRVLGYDGTIQE
jgi:hypothetical protein